MIIVGQTADGLVDFVAVYCHGEFFCYRFTLATAVEVKRQIGLDAANPDLAITWTEASVLCKVIVRMELAAMEHSSEFRVWTRWMIENDIREVLAIEKASFEYPMSQSDLRENLSSRNRMAVVAEQHDRVIGFMIYELQSSRLKLLTVAVHPNYRRRKVGSMLVGYLKGKLSPERRKRLMLIIGERNLIGQQFFRACGLRAVDVLHGLYTDRDDDAYEMSYYVRKESHVTSV